MAGEQHLSGVITPVPTSTDRCGGHVSYGSAPSIHDPYGLWWDTDADCLKVNDDSTTYVIGQQGPQGPQGIQGVQGVQGVQGNAGLGYLACETKSKQSKSNITTVQDLVTFTALTAGLMNASGKHLTLEANGWFQTIGGETPVLVFNLSPFVNIASLDLLRSGGLAAGVNGNFSLRVDVVTDDAGINGNAVISGRLDIEEAGNGTPGVVTTYLTGWNVSSATINYENAITPILQVKAIITACTMVDVVNSKIVVS